MIDSSRPGPKRARWVAAALAMLAAVLIGLVLPAGEASPQGTFGGANFTLASCGGSGTDPVCTPGGATVSPTSRDVLISFDLGTATGQPFTLIRVTSAGGANSTNPTVAPIV